ncbi:serine hydrolase domain-containing protein [Alteromonas sp. W364]|uniref:serine hydrolase domain-containing protein n=1 Tax=Alteromonas sp. W364 TaxID=3075610 RepID=UPI0028883F7F|nr:serine hydrolase domain-containing protein [Alteromonas sp. W364]MDT0629341.1 serine hydrolase domain-containing protein [Alteromonas sp. W364]
MKKVTKIASLFILALAIQLMALPLTYASEKNTYDGMWRGELQISKGVKLAIGIEISENNKTLTINSPNQGMHDRDPSRFTIDGQSISFFDEGLSATFEGKVVDDKLEGTFTQGKTMPLVLHKLSKDDLNRMSFEGKYIGDLKINASSTLPLALHIAVIKDGYSAALDSPAQNSFGIPVNEISIDTQKLSFTSEILGAKFSGAKSSEGYAGTFVQGMPMPLTLSKVNNKNAHLQFKPAEFGEKGGSVAVIENGKITNRFWGEHGPTTQYEIGSISKTFTAYLLAKQVVEGQLELQTTVDRFFENASPISMQALATHTSRLERNPPSLQKSMDPQNPFKHITREMLQEDLLAPTYLPEENKHEYSNFAFAVLGEALAINRNTDLANEMQTHIFDVFKMDNSYLSVDTVPEINNPAKSMAQGHNASGLAVPKWTLGAASGAGAVVSSLDDMIKYAEYMMLMSTEQNALAKLLFTPYTPTAGKFEQGLGWMLMKDDKGQTYAWHNGMTGGFSTFMGFYLDGSRAVIMLNNQASSFDQKAHQLLTRDKSLQSI